MADLEQSQQHADQPQRELIRTSNLIDAENPTITEHPNLHLTPEERRLFGQLFTAADTDKIGVVTGEVAVRFFDKTRLSPDVLGEVGSPVNIG